jgi:hypothetical protein
MTWKREQGYSKYRERIKWLEWMIDEKDKEIAELRKYIPLPAVECHIPSIKVLMRC